PAARPDSANAELERMLAVGSARSLYRLRPSREEQQRNPNGKVGINYVIADTIDLAFTEGEVDIATVRGLKRGVYLDPLPADSTRRDTTARDSTARDSVPRDTGAVAAQRPAPAVLGAPAPAQGGPPATPPAAPAAPVPTTPAATSTTTATPERRAPGGRR
ncbi:MAG TPA: hypothetical protein VLK84_08485, partial [Longimicrobium sp.]|nr:hypothetical protein [Longimicrobium sp.]